MTIESTNEPTGYRDGADIRVRLEPEQRDIVLPRTSTVARMLHGFGLRPTDCLVIRHLSEGRAELLTHDLRTRPGDRITIRKVASSG